MVSQEVIKYEADDHIALEYTDKAGREWSVEISDNGHGDIDLNTYLDSKLTRRDLIHTQMLHAHGYTMFK